MQKRGIKRIKQFLSVARNYNSYPSTVKHLLHQNPEFLKFISDCCQNTLYNQALHLTKDSKKKLGKHKKTIKMLSNKKIKLKKKYNILSLRGGAILPILFSVLSPLLTSLAGKFMK